MLMKRSIKLKIERHPSLLKTLSTCNAACNDILKVGFEKAGWGKNGLHHATYYKIREKYPSLPSSLVCTARDQASAMLKRDKNRILPVKGEFSAIRFNARTISVHFKKKCLSMASQYTAPAGEKTVDIFQMPKEPKPTVPVTAGKEENHGA